MKSLVFPHPPTPIHNAERLPESDLPRIILNHLDDEGYALAWRDVNHNGTILIEIWNGNVYLGNVAIRDMLMHTCSQAYTPDITIDFHNPDSFETLDKYLLRLCAELGDLIK